MMNLEQDLRDRITEDDGLVAGLPPEAAEVVRAWCRERVLDTTRGDGAERAVEEVDRVVATARVVTDVVKDLLDGRSTTWLSRRLAKVVDDGEAALEVLQGAQPLPDRLREVLTAVRSPRRR